MFEMMAGAIGQSPEKQVKPEEDEKILAERAVVEIEALEGSANKVCVVTLQDDGKGIYKPAEGETALRREIPVGTYYLRERAAFELDQFLGFDLVPPTVIREAGLSSGTGSIQRFVENGSSASATKNKYRDKLLEAPKQKQREIFEQLEAINSLIREKRRARSAYQPVSPEFDAMSREIGDLAREAGIKRLKVDELNEEISVIYREAQSKFDDKFKQGLMRLWLFDMITHNSDRHGKNLLITDDDRVVAIDNGMCFNGEIVRFFRDYFDVELLDEIVAPVLALEQRAGWQEELKKKIARLLSEEEITNLVLRIEKIIFFLKQDRRIPKPQGGVNVSGQYATEKLDYFPGFSTKVGRSGSKPERMRIPDETASVTDIALDQTI